MSLEEYKEHYATFIEAGFIAVNQSDEDSAVKLFKAADQINPGNFLSQLGLGYLHLCKLELKQSVKIFTEVLEKDPNNEVAKAFLGLSLSLNPKEVDKGTEILKETDKNTKDPFLKTLTGNAISFVEKFIKKAPTPAQGPLKK
jgi:tetratricopeptide (TPR) repeat protein